MACSLYSYHFIGLGEIPVDPETDPSSYNEAIQDKDVILWQSAMKTEIEFMYSNQVWLFVEFYSHAVAENVLHNFSVHIIPNTVHPLGIIQHGL